MDTVLWNSPFRRKIWNRKGLQKGCSINLTSGYRKKRKTPRKQDRAIGITFELFYKRHKTGLPLFKHPQWKALNRLLSALGTFSLLALFSIFLGCSFHGWLHTIHQKCFSLLPPNTHFSPPLPFLWTPLRLLFTLVWLRGSVLHYSRLQSLPRCKSLVSVNSPLPTGP